MCPCDSTETVATSLSLVRDTTPKQCSIFLGKTTVSSSSLWTAGTPSFPSHPFKCTDTMSSISTPRLVPALAPLALRVSLLGQRQPRQTGSLLSSTRCFPERETSLPFLSAFLLALYRTSSTYRKRVQIPRLYVTQLPIFKTVLSI